MGEPRVTPECLVGQLVTLLPKQETTAVGVRGLKEWGRVGDECRWHRSLVWTGSGVGKSLKSVLSGPCCGGYT